jgi:soluble lytic murein transglycosylase-like protein
LPRQPLHSIGFACVLAASAVLGGCTTSDLGLESQTLSLAGGVVAANDPALPDTVAVTPSILSLAEEQEQIAAAVEPVGYAAPTAASVAALAAASPDSGAGIGGSAVAPRSPELDALIARYAVHHEIPVELLRRVVNRESTFNPAARTGPYWGLMQILPQTARTMGYEGGPEGLLDAETNLKYAGRYLRGAYLVAGGDHDLAVRYYARGYYYDAKRKGLLEATGLGRDRRRMR